MGGKSHGLSNHEKKDGFWGFVPPPPPGGLGKKKKQVLRGIFFFFWLRYSGFPPPSSPPREKFGPQGGGGNRGVDFEFGFFVLGGREKKLEPVCRAGIEKVVGLEKKVRFPMLTRGGGGFQNSGSPPFFLALLNSRRHGSFFCRQVGLV